MLRKGTFPNTCTRKFNDFIQCLEGYLVADELSWEVATLHLAHPYHSSADPLVHFIQEGQSGSDFTGMNGLLRKDPRLCEPFGHASIRASTLLRRQGRLEEAEWLEEYAKGLIGEETLGSRPLYHQVGSRGADDIGLKSGLQTMNYQY